MAPGTMNPNRRSLPFPLNWQIVRVGTADYGGGAPDQVRQLLAFANGDLRDLSFFLSPPGIPFPIPAIQPTPYSPAFHFGTFHCPVDSSFRLQVPGGQFLTLAG